LIVLELNVVLGAVGEVLSLKTEQFTALDVELIAARSADSLSVIKISRESRVVSNVALSEDVSADELLGAQTASIRNTVDLRKVLSIYSVDYHFINFMKKGITYDEREEREEVAVSTAWS